MDFLQDAFMNVVNLILSGFASAVDFIVLLLPKSPFQAYINMGIDLQYMRWMNWLVPVGQMVAIVQAWTVAIALYYLYQTLLRWAKAIA